MSSLADYSIVEKLGYNSREGQVVKGGEELSFNCKFCVRRGKKNPDTGRRLQVRVIRDDRFGYAFCHRCGFRARLNSTYSPRAGSRRGISITVGADDLAELLKPAPDELQLPRGYCPLQPEMHASQYLMSRGISWEDVKHYDLGIARGRIVFPDYLDGKLTYFVLREYTGGTPKYLNSPTPRNIQIYNLGRWVRGGSSQMIIVEGPVSAISAGRDAVGTYGKSFSDEQVEILVGLALKGRLKTIYIALDPDARKESLSLAGKLALGCQDIRLVTLPSGADPNNLGREPFRALLPLSWNFHPDDVAGHVHFMLGDEYHEHDLREGGPRGLAEVGETPTPQEQDAQAVCTV